MLDRRLYPFESHFLAIDGLSYHYLDEGTGEPIVMVHGNPTWSFYFRNLIKAMRHHYRVIAPDHIGMGLSDKPEDTRYSYILENRVENLATLLRDLNIDHNITLIGHDWGGVIATSFAVRHHQKIARLILMNTAAFLKPAHKTFPYAIALAKLPVISAPLVRGLNVFGRVANRVCVKQTKLQAHVAEGYLHPYDSWHNRIAIHRFIQDIPIHPNAPSYDYLKVTETNLYKLKHIPIQLLWGMRDFVFDAPFLETFLEYFPDADVHRYENAGHYVLEDEIDDIISSVSAFLHKHPVKSDRNTS